MVACGVRKVWSREFKDLDNPSDQIRRLRQILADLGMSGRMSLEQAKAIKAKREFAQELGMFVLAGAHPQIATFPRSSHTKHHFRGRPRVRAEDRGCWQTARSEFRCS